MENVIENNKLIAEFMGFESCYRPFTEGSESDVFMELPECGSCIELEDLKYNSSWDWLMEVVEKIESLGFETSLDKNGFFVRYNGSNTQNGLFIKVKIEAVYNACVEFIKWYNNESRRVNQA